MQTIKRFIITQLLEPAGKLALQQFNRSHRVYKKENQSNVVTNVDYLIDEFLTTRITQNFRTHSIISEENGINAKNDHYCWIIDPIDGTSNFVHNIPFFGIIVALLFDSESIATGIYLPALKELYFAQKNKGATLNGAPIQATSLSDITKCLIGYSIEFHKDKTQVKKEAYVIARLASAIQELRTTNCVVDYCYVASGRYGGLLRLTSKIWDVAGPSLLIKESGGIITDDLGNPLDFNFTKQNYKRNYTSLCSGPFLHKKLLRIIH